MSAQPPLQSQQAPQAAAWHGGRRPSPSAKGGRLGRPSSCRAVPPGYLIVGWVGGTISFRFGLIWSVGPVVGRFTQSG